MAASSVVGHVRNRNEDAYLQDPERRLLAVADGLGGHVGGDVASRTAVHALDEALTTERLGHGDPMELLAQALEEADERVRARAEEDPSLDGMGTTAVIAHIGAGTGRVTVGHVGDSRAYALRGQGLSQITEDHVSWGVFGRMLAQALGTGHEARPEVAEVSLEPGDRLLLCTDGLTDMLEDGEIEALLADSDDDEATCGALVEAALSRGGVDNVTVVVATMSEELAVSRGAGGPTARRLS